MFRSADAKSQYSEADEVARLVAQAEVAVDEMPAASIVQKLIENRDYIQAGRWISKQTYLGCYDPEQLLRLRDMLPRPSLNIGGGPNFAYPFWENLDSSTGPLNPKPFSFGSDVHLPFKASTFDLIYTSHCLEHLDEATFQRVISEARRIIKPGGRLVIKIPDFDAVIAAWRDDRAEFFRDDLWNFGELSPTFKNKGVIDGITARAAMVFCGFWNKEYGDLYGTYDKDADGAYCGPAPMSDREMCRLLDGSSPHVIAREMRDFVVGHETDYVFNHQNGWSIVEMSLALRDAGFDVISTDCDKIQRRFAHVPKITQMSEISSYYLAVARG